MAALLTSNAPGRRVLLPPVLPPVQTLEARLLATISMLETVSPRQFGLHENATRFVAAVLALRRWRWPIEQWTSSEVEADAPLARGSLPAGARSAGQPSGRWGLTQRDPERYVYPDSPHAPWFADYYGEEAGELEGCLDRSHCAMFMESSAFRTWRDRVMVDAMERLPA